MQQKEGSASAGSGAQGPAQSMSASSGIHNAPGAPLGFSHVMDLGPLTEAQMELMAGPRPFKTSPANKVHDASGKNDQVGADLGYGPTSGAWADTSSKAAGDVGDDISVIHAAVRSTPWANFSAKDPIPAAGRNLPGDRPIPDRATMTLSDYQRMQLPTEARPFEGWGPKPPSRWYKLCENECDYNGGQSFGYYDRSDQAKSDHCTICKTKMGYFTKPCCTSSSAQYHVYTLLEDLAAKCND